MENKNLSRIEKLQLAVEKGFKYNPINGLITNPTGGITKKITSNGYITLSLWKNKKRHQITGHQFAWFILYNETVECIDHINRIKTDNRPENLRSVTKSQNAMNMSNTKGYFYCRKSKKFIAIIMTNYKRKQLGVFETPQEARDCYLENKNKYHIINN